MDPITGQGMADALRDAEFLSEAVVAGFGGSAPLKHALGRYERRRDAALRPMFSLTLRMAALRPAGAFERALFEALAANPTDADRFFAINSGAAAQSTLFNPASLVRLLGARRIAALLVGMRDARHHAVDALRREVLN
jgi:flavin-dependent dehydrogenase